MSVNHEAFAALPAAADVDKGALRNMLVARMPYALADNADPEQLVVLDPDSGALVWDLLFQGRVFHHDPDDTTTAHDGTTCIVAQGGKRYKLATGTDVLAWSVLSITATPPVSPSIGDAYLVGIGGSGAYAGHDGEVAIETARGTEFISFGVGRLLYVEGEDSFYHRDASGDWILGFGSQSLGDGTVAARALAGGGGRVNWIVESQSLNTPPAIVAGISYIVGPVPTGRWAGKAGWIAAGEGSVENLYEPGEGWTAYDKDLNNRYIYNAGWSVATSVVFAQGRAKSTTSTAPAEVGTPSTSFSYTALTAPAAQIRREDTLKVSITAPNSNAWIEIEIMADLTAATLSVDSTIAIKRDAEANAVAWWPIRQSNSAQFITRKFMFQAPDDQPHDYFIAHYRGTNADITFTFLTRELSYKVLV